MAVSMKIDQKGLVEAMHCCRAVEMSESAMLVAPRSSAVKKTMSDSTYTISRFGTAKEPGTRRKKGTSSRHVTTHVHRP